MAAGPKPAERFKACNVLQPPRYVNADLSSLTKAECSKFLSKRNAVAGRRNASMSERKRCFTFLNACAHNPSFWAANFEGIQADCSGSCDTWPYLLQLGNLMIAEHFDTNIGAGHTENPFQGCWKMIVLPGFSRCLEMSRCIRFARLDSNRNSFPQKSFSQFNEHGAHWKAWSPLEGC